MRVQFHTAVQETVERIVSILISEICTSLVLNCSTELRHVRSNGSHIFTSA